jgi:predicted TIM-barrel fold metal-dependent hydrolase
MQVVDAHVHAWPDSGPGSPARAGWAELRTALALGSVVDRVVLVTPASPPGDDEWTVQTARRHRTSVRAVLRASAVDRAKAEHCGIRLVLDPNRTGSLEALVAEAADARISISLQNPSGEWAAVAAWAARYPSMTFVVDHLGHPDVRLGAEAPEWRALLTLAAHPNVVVKMPNLAHFTEGFEGHRALRPFVRDVLTAYEPHRLLWASDWPNTGAVPYPGLLWAGMRLVQDVDDGAVTEVFRDNAARLFWNAPVKGSAEAGGHDSPPRSEGAPV